MAYNVDTYRTFVEQEMREALRDGGGPRVFGNRGGDFARIVTDVMIDNATMRLAFLCGYMSASIYDPERLRHFLQKENAELRVILDGLEQTPTIDSALDHLRDFRSKIKVQRIKYQLGFHFGIADDAHVRREEDIHDRTATVIFGDKELAGLALTTFDKLWHLQPN
jgi:hypothetical protein